jgi:hypothetical protein
MEKYRSPFSPQSQFRCVKPFVMSGKEYRLGDAVQTKGIEVRRLRQMFEMRMIDTATPETMQTPPPVVQASVPTAPEPAVEMKAGSKLRVDHQGFGRYVVLDESGAVVDGPMSKADAEKRAGA